MNIWQTSGDISNCSVIPSSIRYHEEESTNDNAGESSTRNKKNRMAIANHDFRAGDIVLRNAPLACSLLTSNDDDDVSSSKYCAFCFATEQKLSRCARCQSIWYCSRDCQKQDFALHKKECLYWAKQKKGGINHSSFAQQNGRIKAEISLLIRTHAKMELQQAKERELAPSFPQTTSPQTIIHSRIDHLASLAQYPFTLDPSEESIIQEATAAILWFQQEQQQSKKKKSTKQDSTRQEIQTQIENLLRIFRVNNFGITDELLKVVASGVYPLGALLNHSCRPNCVLRYHSAKKQPPVLEIVACRQIAKGEELTHSYVELVQPQRVRQERLKSNYGFDCHCQRCMMAPSEQSNSMPKDWMQLQDSIQVGIFLNYHNPCCASNQKWNLQTDGIRHLDGEQVKELRQMATHLQAKAKQCMAMDNLEGELLLLGQCVGVLSQLLQHELSMKPSAPHETALDLYQVRGDFLGSLLVAGQTESAIHECEYVVAVLVSILCNADETNCPNHPILGLQLFTLGDLYSAKGWEDKAQRTFEWARKIMMVSHGSNSNMVHLLKDRY